MKPLLILIYGPNGAGKTTLARALATKYRGLQIQIDTFSSMARGRFWHTRQNNKDKMVLVLGVLDAAMKSTSHRRFFLEGVLIYPFMFKLLEAWCKKNFVKFVPIYLTGNLVDLDFRIRHRKILKKNWNEHLPEFFENFHYKKARKISSSGKTSQVVLKEIQAVIGERG
ncbi:MAG: AAA family ATPase [Candidatus Brennerbacteria bacterium]|nr:AAA family ATPase [Candidatus Brennerbacteria bacterium]